MSNKAYDTESNKEVYAADCIAAEKGRYICPFCHDKGKYVPVCLRKTDGEKASHRKSVDTNFTLSKRPTLKWLYIPSWE